jgi:hypothetical protein
MSYALSASETVDPGAYYICSRPLRGPGSGRETAGLDAEALATEITDGLDGWVGTLVDAEHDDPVLEVHQFV